MTMVMWNLVIKGFVSLYCKSSMFPNDIPFFQVSNAYTALLGNVEICLQVFHIYVHYAYHYLSSQ